MKKAETIAKDLLASADIIVGGSRPQDITIHNDDMYNRVLRDGDLGLGESYMEGWWDANELDEFFAHILEADLLNAGNITPSLVAAVASAKLFNQQKKQTAKSDVSHHYDIGNDLYAAMLDERMIYTCAYWKDAKNLEQAQEAKLDLICRKLQLKKGMTLLDIGCGWGGFAKYAAEKYDVKVTGITPAGEQVKLAKQNTKGLDVEILQLDYRDVTGQFDRIVSIGMLEHVGGKNYKEFFEVCNKALVPGGMMLHHTIGGTVKYNPGSARWMRKYIFPGTYIPTLGELADASAHNSFVIEDVHNLGTDYDKTLMEWYKRFDANYSKLDHAVYDEEFYRMWKYYLLVCAALFRTHGLQLWQVVFRRAERGDAYKAVR
jgi:cyclopropane-fatty-acyl-phospholipid synthase